MKRNLAILFCSLLVVFSGCRKDSSDPGKESEIVTIFSINDPHAQIGNFGKIKHIVDAAEEKGNVIVVCGGDIFSGNPVVDFIPDKGYPIIDLMNRSGFDVAVIGNHEYDYGQEVLVDRMNQADFDFICANVDMTGTQVPQPDPWVTVATGDLDITFLGFVETTYSSGQYIPATHPLKIEGITFEPVEDVITEYRDLKSSTDSDLLVLLSHLGTSKDVEIATNFPVMDLIIGGHSHAIVNTTVNGIPIYQCGSYLRYLGKIELVVWNSEIVSTNFELIDLTSYNFSNAEIDALIDDYNDIPELDEVIGYNEVYLSRNTNLGCFYTDALRQALDADISFQNGGGIRADLDVGDITVREIYSFDPFNNGAHTYSMTISEVKEFLQETKAGLHYSGVIIEDGYPNGISIKDLNGSKIPDNRVVKVGINDFLPAIYHDYFSDPVVSDKTTAEEIIEYLKDNPAPINYADCNRYYSFSY